MLFEYCLSLDQLQLTQTPALDWSGAPGFNGYPEFEMSLTGGRKAELTR
jgi:hypothetical protein